MKIRVKIGQKGNLVDRTSIIFEQGFFITHNIGSTIDILELTLLDKLVESGSGSTFKRTDNLLTALVSGHDIQAEDFNDATNILFGGIVVEIRRELIGIDILYHITAQDWTMLASRATFTLQRVNITDSTLIQAAFTNAELSEINTKLVTDIPAGFVNSGRVFDFMGFVGATLSSMLDVVTSATGFFWWIDPDKFLHYERFAQAQSSLEFTDVIANLVSGSIVPYYSLDYTRTMGQFNAVEVRGHLRISDDLSQIYKNDGVEISFSLHVDSQALVAGRSYQPLTAEPTYRTDPAILDVYVNPLSNLNEVLDTTETDVDVINGTKYSVNEVILIDDEKMLISSITSNTLTVTRAYLSSTAATHSSSAKIFTQQEVQIRDAEKTLTIQFSDTPSVDVIWESDFIQIHFKTAPPNLADDSFRVIGRTVSPIAVKRKDQAAIDRVGRVFRNVINESLIRSNEQAIDVSKAFLREQGPKENIELLFTEDGLKVNTLVNLTSTVLGINETDKDGNMIGRGFLVTSVTIRILGGEVVEYEASLERSAAIFNVLAVG